MDQAALAQTERPAGQDDPRGFLPVIRNDNFGAYRQAVEECRKRYGQLLSLAGIYDEEHFDLALAALADDLDSGEYFMARVGRMARADSSLVLTLYVMRVRWLQEYGSGLEEQLLIDQALLALYHEIRIHEMICKTQACAEHELSGEKPLRHEEWDRQGSYQYQVDEYLRTMQARLIPAVERCQRMMTRALRELRRTRVTRLTIQYAEQVNVAQQQVVATDHRAPALPAM